MDNQEHSDENIRNAIDILSSMFGSIVSKEVIFTVAESCSGNLELSVDTIMSITSDSNTMDTTDSLKVAEKKENACIDTVSVNKTSPELATTSHQSIAEKPAAQPSMSYVSAAQTTPPPPKPVPKPDRLVQNQMNFWTDQIRQIIMHHNNGFRIIVILRGLPGSGKSHLAKQIIEIIMGSDPLNLQTHILSTDDYFMVRGKYLYDKSKLSLAHDWNHDRIYSALNKGISPIIVDNTNTEMWEMSFPVYYGVQAGYIIEIVEPNTSWKWNPNMLFKKNSHHVPYASIKKMLDRYERDVTAELMLRFCKASYPPNLTPPVLRNIPPVAMQTGFITNKTSTEAENTVMPNINRQGVNDSSNQEKKSPSPSKTAKHVNETKEITCDAKHSTTCSTELKLVDENKESNVYNNIDDCEKEINENDEVKDTETTKKVCDITEKQKIMLDAEKSLEEIQKVEEEWENGEQWDDGNQKSDNETDLTLSKNAPKPPRKHNSLEIKSDGLMESVNQCEDWSCISMYMTPWHSEPEKSDNIDKPAPIEKITSSTCVEVGDTDMSKNNYKIISSVARDINSPYTTIRKEKIPDQRMLDKSTMTNEHTIIESLRCKNEEQHFIAFRKLFKNINRAELRDVFDKCCGDVNWAVDIVFDGMANKIYDANEMQDVSDDEEDIEECDCLAAYNIIPDRKQTIKLNVHAPEGNAVIPEVRPPQQKRPKQEPLSENSLKLKRQIEKNVKISEEHYSPHFLKLRQMRHGQSATEEGSLAIPSTSGTGNNQSDENVSPKEIESKPIENESSPMSDDDTSSEPSSETYVTVDLRKSLIQILDELFGRKEMQYPENVLPTANMPMSLMNEINALWVESLSYQLDQQSDQANLMMKQDEEIARQFVSKEIEFMKEGKEPVVPEFKEIMDMDLALSLYQKDVAKWKKKEPQDLAAKMSRDKLYNLFPEISSDVLGELLMAHENNFQATVEVLLMSTGRTDILEAKNGVNKFVMEKELQRQKDILEQERKALSEEEWPLLPKGETLEMGTVQYYRDEAEMHLEQRNYNHNKAQHCIRMGVLQVANYYIDAAKLHKQKYEIAKNLAVSSLIQIQATRHPDSATIDLHYLRVTEAKESLDIFLDTHIRKLKESQARGGPRQNTLFFITGRGIHSNGGPKIKPAVKKRLLERGLIYAERNPGMLMAKVCADDRLSYQLQGP